LVLSAVLSAEVTRRTLVLGSEDSVTGWFQKSWSDSTIDMIILPSGSQFMHLLPGAYARYDAVGRTQDPVFVGDQIKDGSRYFEVREVKPWYLLNSFMYRDCQLAELPLYEVGDEPSATTAGSEAVDPRTRTKTALTTLLTGTNITKDDGGTPAPFLITFGYPDYPLQYVFKSPKHRYVAFTIDEPNNSTPLISHDQLAYGYEHHIPIHILCVNQPDATGTNLKSKARAELRRVIGLAETIDLRLMDREVQRDRQEAGLFLYDTEFTLLYRTDTT